MNSAANRLAFFAAGSASIALIVYWATLAPDLAWANAAIDGGELITASMTLGVPHPPGYPLYILLGKLFSSIPLGTVAYRYNLFSAVCAAGAAGLLVLTIGALYRTRVSAPIASAASLLFAFTPLVWSQAIVAEVYALNALVLAAFLLAWSRRSSPLWTGLWLGLASTTHLTSLLMLPVALIANRRLRMLSGMALGLTPLLLLPWLARGNSPVVWGNAAQPNGWWWLVSARLYSSNVQFSPEAARLLGLLQAVVLGPAGLIIARRAIRAGSRAEPQRPTIDNFRLVSIILSLVVALYGGFALLYFTPDAATLFIPGLMILALLIAPGLERMGKAALLLPALMAIVAFPGQDLSRDRQARQAAELLLREAPANAILLTPGDRTIFTLWYFHHVEGQRHDLRLVDANLFAFDWYRERLSRQFPDIHVPQDDNLVALQRANENSRPFCLAGLHENPGKLPSGSASPALLAGNPPYLLCSLRINDDRK